MPDDKVMKGQIKSLRNIGNPSLLGCKYRNKSKKNS